MMYLSSTLRKRLMLALLPYSREQIRRQLDHCAMYGYQGLFGLHDDTLTAVLADMVADLRYDESMPAYERDELRSLLAEYRGYQAKTELMQSMDASIADDGTDST